MWLILINYVKNNVLDVIDGVGGVIGDVDSGFIGDVAQLWRKEMQGEIM